MLAIIRCRAQCIEFPQSIIGTASATKKIINAGCVLNAGLNFVDVLKTKRRPAFIRQSKVLCNYCKEVSVFNIFNIAVNYVLLYLCRVLGK